MTSSATANDATVICDNGGSPYLTLKEAAARARVSRRSLSRMVKSGRLPAYAVGGGHRKVVLRDELDAAIRAGRVQP